jgi:glycosyltransferase involved in cell wall biosynthesis
MQNRMGKQVLIIQSQIKQYRMPFFENLREALRKDGVTLKVGYSDPPPSETGKRDNCDLPSDYGVKVTGYWVLGNRVIWQPLLNEVAAADLVIVEHANKYIMNHILLVWSAFSGKRVAFWGHGRNRQSQRDGFSEWLKLHTLSRVDWWFAYTAGTVEYLTRRGVLRSKITNVENAIDTTVFREQLASVSESEVAAARRKLRISTDSKVGLFCGGVTREKMPEFLVESAVRIRRLLPRFELVAIGGGPQQVFFERASDRCPWFHYLGPRFGREKAVYFKLADVFLMPGLLGLAVLDAFAAGVPVVTTNVPIHSPEIEYLEEGRNGLVTAVNPESYSEAVVTILRNHEWLERLRHGARACGEKHTIENMVANFCHGVLCALGYELSEHAEISTQR